LTQNQIPFRGVSISTFQYGLDSLHDDGSAEHVHLADEPDVARSRGREFDDDRLVDGSARRVFKAGNATPAWLVGTLAVQAFPRMLMNASLHSHLAYRSQELNCADAAQNDSRSQKQNLRPYKKAIPSTVIPLEVFNWQHAKKHRKHG